MRVAFGENLSPAVMCREVYGKIGTAVVTMSQETMRKVVRLSSVARSLVNGSKPADLGVGYDFFTGGRVSWVAQVRLKLPQTKPLSKGNNGQ